MSDGYKWERLWRAPAKAPTEALIAAWMESLGLDREAALARMAEYQKTVELWTNSLYQVEAKRHPDGFVHLNIRRRDGHPCIRDWRHFQQIKNELVGPECEAIELYPAESRLVDTSNKYHLFCVADPTFRFPVEIGTGKRDVRYGDDTEGGLRQRGPMKIKGGSNA